ncbi:primase-helicase zinc-binding domain-containing protein [Desulforhabdus sp. TSK]|uniref:primase-helicase zinc-binding domain-containing protein n=1 Tax=Desulforhabdus sp. TSK TaxID=2925014 RepID=UPI001FC825B2|nr:primase-helicase zinc-binding domain-containing protein [Desulforhabdus sp. TSK]GKT10537.1 hypothetical protein DSTSK_38420 [Desulforhabdus sp. TSK]
MNILYQLQLDGITVKNVSNTNGGEYSSPCPGCGGKDRFRSWPEQGQGGKWWCRRCGKSGDLIQYLREFHGLSFRDACKRLGMVNDGCKIVPGANLYKNNRNGGQRKPRPISNPPALWQNKAESFVLYAETNLWSDVGTESLGWLKEQRGLIDETIKTFRLGWNPQDWYPKREVWGLPTKLKENDRPKKLVLPTGLVIPKLQNGKILRLRTRRAVPYNGSRYSDLPGSNKGALVIPGGKGKVVVVVESDLDALLIWQEAKDLVTVMALGSAQARPDEEASNVLEGVQDILVALDVDDAGANEAWHWWRKHFSKARRWPPVRGKDPGEMWKVGVDVRLWIKAGLSEMPQDDPAEAFAVLADIEPSEPNYQPETRIREDTQIEGERKNLAAPDRSDPDAYSIEESIEEHGNEVISLVGEKCPQLFCETCLHWIESFPASPHGVCRNVSAKQCRFQNRAQNGCAFHSLRGQAHKAVSF